MPRHYRNKHGGDHGHTSTKAKHLRITKHPTQTRQQRRKHHPHTRQLQRAYVAMVLAQDTDYVLLDEPLNNLDMQHSVQMMKPSAAYSTPPFRCLITTADYSPAIFNP